MHYSGSGPRDWHPEIMQRHNAVAILLLFLSGGAFLCRLIITPDLMNLVMDYTNDGGPFYAKFHIGTYAIAATLLLALFTRPFVLLDDDISRFRSCIRYLALLVGLVVFLVATGRLSATGFVIETYVSAMLAALLMLAQNPQSRRLIGHAILSLLITSAIVGIGEALTQSRLIPYTEGEPFFRATGLAGHPLALGAHCAIAIGFVPLTRWRIWIKTAVIAILFVGCAAAGARFALMFSSLEILLLLLFLRWPKLSRRHERQAKLIALLVTLVIGAVLLAILAAGGFLGRFGDTVVDANALARIRIYQIFQHVSWKDIFSGMDATTLLALVNEKLGLPFIESAPVVIILLMGLPAAIVFASVVIGFVLRLLRDAPRAARIAAAIFILIDLSNNALATKTSDILLLTLLVLAFHAAGHPARNPVSQRYR